MSRRGFRGMMVNDLIVGKKYGDFVLIDISKREKEDGRYEISFTGSEVTPVVMSDEYLLEGAENYVESLKDCAPEVLIDYMVESEVPINELPDYLISTLGVEGIFDISLYPESYPNSEGEDVYFLSSGCGQISLDEVEFFDEEFGEFIMVMWETYHLKTVDKEVVELIERKLDKYLEVIFNDSDECIRRLVKDI